MAILVLTQETMEFLARASDDDKAILAREINKYADAILFISNKSDCSPHYIYFDEFRRALMKLRRSECAKKQPADLSQAIKNKRDQKDAQRLFLCRKNSSDDEVLLALHRLAQHLYRITQDSDRKLPAQQKFYHLEGVSCKEYRPFVYDPTKDTLEIVHVEGVKHPGDPFKEYKVVPAAGVSTAAAGPSTTHSAGAGAAGGCGGGSYPGAPSQPPSHVGYPRSGVVAARPSATHSAGAAAGGGGGERQPRLSFYIKFSNGISEKFLPVYFASTDLKKEESLNIILKAIESASSAGIIFNASLSRDFKSIEEFYNSGEELRNNVISVSTTVPIEIDQIVINQAHIDQARGASTVHSASAAAGEAGGSSSHAGPPSFRISQLRPDNSAETISINFASGTNLSPTEPAAVLLRAIELAAIASNGFISADSVEATTSGSIQACRDIILSQSGRPLVTLNIKPFIPISTGNLTVTQAHIIQARKLVTTNPHSRIRPAADHPTGAAVGGGGSEVPSAGPSSRHSASAAGSGGSPEGGEGAGYPYGDTGASIAKSAEGVPSVPLRVDISIPPYEGPTHTKSFTLPPSLKGESGKSIDIRFPGSEEVDGQPQRIRDFAMIIAISRTLRFSLDRVSRAITIRGDQIIFKKLDGELLKRLRKLDSLTVIPYDIQLAQREIKQRDDFTQAVKSVPDLAPGASREALRPITTSKLTSYLNAPDPSLGEEERQLARVIQEDEEKGTLAKAWDQSKQPARCLLITGPVTDHRGAIQALRQLLRGFASTIQSAEPTPESAIALLLLCAIKQGVVKVVVEDKENDILRVVSPAEILGNMSEKFLNGNFDKATAIIKAHEKAQKAAKSGAGGPGTFFATAPAASSQTSEQRAREACNAVLTRYTNGGEDGSMRQVFVAVTRAAGWTRPTPGNEAAAKYLQTVLSMQMITSDDIDFMVEKAEASAKQAAQQQAEQDGKPFKEQESYLNQEGGFMTAVRELRQILAEYEGKVDHAKDDVTVTAGSGMSAAGAAGGGGS